MFICSILLSIANLIPLETREDIDNSKNAIYELQDAGKIDSAHLLVDLVIQEAEKLDYNYGTALSIFIKSYLFRMENKLGESFILNLKALRLLKDDSDVRAKNTLAQIYHNTGEILIKHFKYQEAIQYFNQGLEISTSNNLDERTQNLLYNRGYAYWSAKSLQNARKDFQRSLAIAQKLEDEWMILNNYSMHGEVSMQFQNYAEARSYFQKIADHHFEKESVNEYKCMAFTNIGRSHQAEGNMQLAEEIYTEGLKYCKLENDNSKVFEIQIRLVDHYLERGEWEKAQFHGELAIANYESTILSPEFFRLFNMLATITLKLNQPEKAEEYQKKYLAENEAFLTSQRQTQAESERYNMDTLTAGYFQEIEDNKQQISIMYLSIAIVLSILGFVLVQYRTRNSYANRLETQFLDSRHRYMNNLILLKNWFKENETKNSDEVISFAQQRIDAISTINRHLDQLSHEKNTVQSRSFLTDISASLLGSFQCTMEIEDHPLQKKISGPLGMITNELITNGLKYGAEPYSIKFYLSKEHYVLEIEDSGPGLKDLEKQGTGSRILKLLSRQLKGKLIYNNKVDITPRTHGTIVTFTFRN